MRGEKTVLHDISLRIQAGEHVGDPGAETVAGNPH